MRTYRIPLTSDTFGQEERLEAFRVLLSGHYTMGSKVREFEDQVASDYGVAGAVMVNSGGSANLLAMAALSQWAPNPVIFPGDEVIIPAVTWSTGLWPVVHVGGFVVFADVDPQTLNVTTESIEKSIGPQTKAVFLAHLLGNPAPIEEIRDLCYRKGITLIEDCCEALDAESDEVDLVGTYGRFSTLSFYFSHHISTMEGGMILCRDEEDVDLLRAMRAHGWTRHQSLPTQERHRKENPDIDKRFLFVEQGFNFKPMEIQAAIGLVQWRRRKDFLLRRRSVASVWEHNRERHSDVFVPMNISQNSSHFAFPLVLHPDCPLSRADLIHHMDMHDVETRPILGGNLARHPIMKRVPCRMVGPLQGADLIHERGIYVGIDPFLGSRDIAHFCNVMDAFADKARH